MPLTKSTGNMYSWITHMHTHLGGKCPHQCSYCYVGKSRYGVIPRYEGEIRLIEKELKVNYGEGKTIFIEHMNDMFAIGVPEHFVNQIIGHCKQFPDDIYVFQSKNPAKFVEWYFPQRVMIGTTIETNREITISKAPHPMDRFNAMKRLRESVFQDRYEVSLIFITIEPIMKFDLNVMMDNLIAVHPDFINIGADSKNSHLPEPSKEDVKALIKAIQEAGLNIKIKNNLGRFLNE